MQVRKKLMKPLPSNSQELLLTDVASWAATSTHCDVKEIRDAKEIQLLGRILGLLGEGKYEEIVDLAVMRVREVRFAKQPGSSWERAASLKLMFSSFAVNTSLPDGGMVL